MMFFKKRFLPLFGTQFLGAFNDNIFRNALGIYIVYHIADQMQIHPTLFLNLAAALFILPFFLFSVFAGHTTDYAKKHLLLRRIKLAEILIMLAAGIGFWTNNIYWLLFVLFFMGIQSAFFGPIKYSALPILLKRSEIIPANAYVSSGTFLAILCGTILGSYLGKFANPWPVSFIVVIVAICGWFCSLLVPKIATYTSQDNITKNFFRITLTVVKDVFQNKEWKMVILSISWFWMFGIVVLSQLPDLVKNYFYGDVNVNILFLALFCLGIGAGSLFYKLILNKKLDLRIVLIGLVGYSLFLGDIVRVTYSLEAQTDLKGVKEFIANPSSIHLMVNFFLLAFFGGIYIVPLNSYLQFKGELSRLSRIISVNNLFNALFMFGASVLNVLLIKLGLNVLDIFLFYVVASLLFFFPCFFFIKKVNHSNLQ